MKQGKIEKLTSSIVLTILQKVYDSVSKVMQTIAPLGWKQTPYHQEMISYRKMLYDDYKDIKSPHSESNTINRPDPEQDIPWNEEIDFESYFLITFPPLYHDHLELFYILAGLLLQITADSTLYGDHDGYAYYFDEIQIEELVIEIAYRNKQIEKEEANLMLTICPCPPLDDMDLLYCLETLFTILKKQGFHLNFWDYELLLITDLQEAYQHIFYQDLHYVEKEQQLGQIQSDIQQVLEQYDGLKVDPLHLPSIIALFNRRKISPLVLAYLHVYYRFPRGYPYHHADYEP
ncbi:hypothetical protein [Sphingobacterium faecium]|uniref:hypothetical protein n=1 Tax=Sphingobacterium faecium TaxID=34087 RepID=UPI0032079826